MGWNWNDALMLIVGKRHENVDAARRGILRPGQRAKQDPKQDRGESMFGTASGHHLSSDPLTPCSKSTA